MHHKEDLSFYLRFHSLKIIKIQANFLFLRKLLLSYLVCQIENEYGNVDIHYGPAGKSYINWATSMATSLDTGVPWVMCQQVNAPDPIVCFLLLPIQRVLCSLCFTGLSSYLIVKFCNILS